MSLLLLLNQKRAGPSQGITATVAEVRLQTGAAATGTANFFHSEYVILQAFERDIAQQLRASGVKTLCYMNASSIASYQAGMAHAFNLDYNWVLANHPDWFTHKGGVIFQRDGFPNTYQMNQHLVPYQNAWRDYVLGELDDGMWTGTMVDDVNFNPAGYKALPYDECPDRETYEAQTFSFLQHVGPAIMAAGHLFVCNVQHQWPYTKNSLRSWLQYMSGNALEHYCKSSDDQYAPTGLAITEQGGPDAWGDDNQNYLQYSQEQTAVFTPTVLDNFNRADEGPPLATSLAGWTVQTGVGLSLQGNQIQSPYPNYHGSYYNTTFSFPLAWGVTVKALGVMTPTNDHLQLWMTDASGTGYSAYIRTQGAPAWVPDTQRFQLSRWDAGAETSIYDYSDSNTSNWYAVGDKIILYYDGSTVFLYRYDAANNRYVVQASAGDSSYPTLTGVRLGIVPEEPNWKLDDFATFAPQITPSAKIAIPIIYGFADDAWTQLYARASFYMEWNGSSQSALAFEGNTLIDPYAGSAWRLTLGKPTELKQSIGFGWKRAYQNGIAIINPNDSNSQTFPVPGTYYKPDGTTVSGAITLPVTTATLLSVTPPVTPPPDPGPPDPTPGGGGGTLGGLIPITYPPVESAHPS